MLKQMPKPLRLCGVILHRLVDGVVVGTRLLVGHQQRVVAFSHVEKSACSATHAARVALSFLTDSSTVVGLRRVSQVGESLGCDA